MKYILKILVSSAIIAAIAGSAYFVWSNYFGTAKDARVKVARTESKSARAAAARIDRVAAASKNLPAVWAGLKFDEVTEANMIIDDSASNRGYKVEVLRDPSAIKIQKDIIAAEKELSSAITAARKSVRAIEGIGGYMPAAIKADAKKAGEDADRAVKKGEALAADLKELKYAVDIWGFLSISLKINGSLLGSFDKVAADLAAGDFATSGAGARDLIEGVNESVTWLTHGRQELTNIGVYSEDADAILAFISEAKTTAEAFNNAAAAGTRGDTVQTKSVGELAVSELSELKKKAEAQAVGTDFITWFLANAERRLGNP